MKPQFKILCGIIIVLTICFVVFQSFTMSNQNECVYKECEVCEKPIISDETESWDYECEHYSPQIDKKVEDVLKEVRKIKGSWSYTNLGYSSGAEYMSEVFSIINKRQYLSPKTKRNIGEILWTFQEIDAKNSKDCGRWDKMYQYLVHTVGCTTLVRVGKSGDGGKYLCNMHKIPKNNCIVYSFGSSIDISFDNHVIELLGCDSFGFDPTVTKESLEKQLRNLKIHFNPIGIGPLKDGKWTMKGNPIKTLEDIVEQFGHKKVPILKIDIETHEISVFPQIFKSNILRKIDVKLIMVEYHATGHSCKDRQKLLNFIKPFYIAGYFMYSAEENIVYPPGIEFAFVHESFL